MRMDTRSRMTPQKVWLINYVNMYSSVAHSNAWRMVFCGWSRIHNPIFTPSSHLRKKSWFEIDLWSKKTSPLLQPRDFRSRKIIMHKHEWKILLYQWAMGFKSCTQLNDSVAFALGIKYLKTNKFYRKSSVFTSIFSKKFSEHFQRCKAGNNAKGYEPEKCTRK